MGVSTTVLPDGSEYLVWAYDIARDTVSHMIQRASPTLYLVAVYSLAGDVLINIAQDVAGQTFFACLRRDWGINDFVSGVISASSDESTSESLLVPDAFKNLTLSDLQNLKTPYGRAYLAIAQKIGTLWGLS